MKLKRTISMLVTIIMLIGLLPAVNVNAASSDAEILSKIEELSSLMVGNYFTVNQKGCRAYESGHGCANCKTSEIVKASWFKNMFGEVSYNQFAPQYYGAGNKRIGLGCSCFGFAAFAEWYIFRQSNTSYVDTDFKGSYDFNYENATKYLKVGDLLRFGGKTGHSAIFISADAEGYNVLHCNYSSVGSGELNCKVKRNKIKYTLKNSISSYKVFHIARATNRTIAEETPTASAPSITTENVYDGKNVIMNTATAGAEIRYTMGIGQAPEPQQNSSYYSSPVAVYNTGNTVVKAKAFKSGYNASSTSYADVSVSKLPAPDISSSYTPNGIVVNISNNNGAEIYYTTNGSVPTRNSNRYTGGFIVTDTTTIKAISVQKGSKNSDVATKQITATVPKAPQIALFNTNSKIAVNDSVSINWNKVDNAFSYYVNVYRNGKMSFKTEVTDTSYTYKLDKEGKYTFSVTAKNFKGQSTLSNEVSVQAMADRNVIFEDWDGRIIEDLKVRYGYSVTAPTIPEREHYKFVGWSITDLRKITEDLTVTAQYEINKYTVTFYDTDGKTLIGEPQRIEAFQSAVVPDETDVVQIKDNYKFSGWYVDPSCECKDYTCVTSDMKIIAKQIWADPYKPLVLSVNSAVLQEGNSYVADITINSTDQSITNFKIIGILKTSSGKTVKATVLEENMKKAATKDVTCTINLVDYDDNGNATQNIATRMEFVAVAIENEGKTGATLSELVHADIEPEWTDWSEWTTEEYSESDTRMVKTKQQTRARNREYQTSSISNNIGGDWELYDTTSSVGGWSGWSTSYPGDKANREIDSRYIQPTYKTQYRYSGYTDGTHCHFCPAQGQAYYGTSFYAHSSGWKDSPVAKTYWSKTQRCGVYGCCNKTMDGCYKVDGKSYYYEHTQQVQTGGGYYEYRYRDTTYTYKFRRWSNWSEWSDDVQSGNEVEYRTLYSYSDKLTDPSDYEEIDEFRTAYTISGNLPSTEDVNMEGRIATVLVYKDRNMDPTEAQLQHVEQITLGEDGAYNFTFTPREEISDKTGNYIVALSVEGDSGITNLEIIEAPKPKYTVKFVAEGEVISEQTVEHGGNATVPVAPHIEGYSFVKWNDRTSYITSDWTVSAVYEKSDYTVVFVDFANNTVTMQEYLYGDEVKLPESDTMICEGRKFAGWYTILDGGTRLDFEDGHIFDVEQNSVLYADWTPDKYTVVFINEDGETISEQTVEYGESATLPDTLTVDEGKLFAGWATDVEWWDVKTDMTVYPIVIFEDTAIAPTASHYYGSDENVVILESGTENATIIYTTDGTEPNISDIDTEGASTKVYTAEEGIVITEDTEVKAIAYAENKNASETVSFNIAYELIEVGENGYVSQISGNNAVGKAGKQAKAVFSISENPGIASLKLSATYDSKILTLKEIQNGAVFANALFTPSPVENNPAIATWAATSDSTNNGTLVSLVFDVAEDAEIGDYPINFTVEAFNSDEEVVGVIKTVGYVSVVANEFGDSNGDGDINLKDVTRILKHLSGWGVTIDEHASDVNVDGIVNLQDITRLLKYLAGWSVTLGE